MKVSDTGGKEFEAAPAGNHVARCVSIIDIGTQTSEYQGKTNHARKIVVRWELPNEVMNEGEFAGKPFLVSAFYTASISEKANLRKVLVSWRGREFTDDELMGFEIGNILDKPCLVNITHTEKGKARVSGVGPLPKGMQMPVRVNDTFYFSLEKDEYDSALYEKLPDYYKGEIKKSPEWAELQGSSKPPSSAGKFDDFGEDIPF